MKLYSYWRSTTSFRVRAALNLKSVAYDLVPVDLVAGDQRDEGYRALNPNAGVPTLVLDDGTVLTQAMAIMDYIDAIWPEPQLIPSTPLERAKMMAAAQTVACDIHPVNNLRVIAELKSRFGATPDQARNWMCHWMSEGFRSLEKQLADNTQFSFGSAPNVADLCVVAQIYNARRWGLDLHPFPKLRRVEAACLNVPAIAVAHPDQQVEAQEMARETV
ncbi:MAG: maleylacetoacetate isomerase [Pseudomonadota bacterium]